MNKKWWFPNHCIIFLFNLHITQLPNFSENGIVIVMFDGQCEGIFFLILPFHAHTALTVSTEAPPTCCSNFVLMKGSQSKEI